MISKLVRRATATHHQIRQHANGAFQVFRGRYTPTATPIATSYSLDGAVYCALRRYIGLGTLRALQTDAAEAGDLDMVAICERAIEGDRAAINACRKAVLEAEAAK